MRNKIVINLPTHLPISPEGLELDEIFIYDVETFYLDYFMPPTVANLRRLSQKWAGCGIERTALIVSAISHNAEFYCMWRYKDSRWSKWRDDL